MGRLEEKRSSLDLGELRSQAVDYLRRRELAFVARLELNEEAPRIGGLGAAGADNRTETRDVGVAGNDSAKLLLQTLHFRR